MKQKKLSNTILIILALIVIPVAIYFIFSQKQEPESKPASNPTSEIPSLSTDKKSVVVESVAESSVLLTVDNDTIFNWFKTESQLCDEHNLTSTPQRKTFCEDKVFFKSQTRFASIVVSPDEMKIGFTIESDTLSPDKVAGIFLRTNNEIQILTNYYLGNEFVSFSPSGANFVFSSYCFESNCGFTIKDSDTLADKASFGSDLDHSDYRFIRWISDTEIEYKVGTELKRESF